MTQTTSANDRRTGWYPMLTVILIVLLPLLAVAWSQAGAPPPRESGAAGPAGAYVSGVYHNFFTELLGKSQGEIQAKIDSAFRQLYYGDSASQRLYYPSEPGMAYILDTGNDDVRTEGMSYGMMIAVQMNRKEEFDRLWRWAKTFMQFQEGSHRGYFAWHCRPDGTKLDSTAASDGEEWFVMALFFASARWGNGDGMLNYRAEAGIILNAMLHKNTEPDHGAVTDMFNAERHLVAFVPTAQANHFTDPSYQVPQYYELWARWAEKDNAFWCAAATASRRLLQASANPRTGLAPDYSRFDGAPIDPWPGGHADFRFDAWRVGMNVAVDWLWFQKDPWQVTESNRLLEFFHSQGMAAYVNQYTLDGKPLSSDHSRGLVAMNAVAALAATSDLRKEFVQALWDTTIPSGRYRYYDGLLYMMALLHVSGDFRIYDPTGKTIPTCPE